MRVDSLPTWETVAFAVPVEIGVFWPIFWIAGQKDPSPLEIREALSWHSILDELLSINQYPEVTIHRPESAIELPVGIL